ncbi:MAG: hypothetical protein IT287_01560 [Bdellovibrionaceae bacterium]|nr:hypothetical protein [Pseudobdellovibrionaceae bacterium]
MKASWVGFFIASVVLYFGVFKSAPNPAIFFDQHAIILVIGGTVAAALIAFPFKKIEDIASLIIFSVLRRRKSSLLDQAKDLIRLAQLHHSGQPLNVINADTHPFMRKRYIF